MIRAKVCISLCIHLAQYLRSQEMTNRNESTPASKKKGRRVVVIVVPPVEELGLVGPMQVLGAANRLSKKAIYSLEVVTIANHFLMFRLKSPRRW
jgi:hypothetical protein